MKQHLAIVMSLFSMISISSFAAQTGHLILCESVQNNEDDVDAAISRLNEKLQVPPSQVNPISDGQNITYIMGAVDGYYGRYPGTLVSAPVLIQMPNKSAKVCVTINSGVTDSDQKNYSNQKNNELEALKKAQERIAKEEAKNKEKEERRRAKEELIRTRKY